MLAHPAFADVPLLLEVPGYKIDGAGKGPDKPNIDLVKEIRGQVAGGSAPASAKKVPAKKKAPATKK